MKQNLTELVVEEFLRELERRTASKKLKVNSLEELEDYIYDTLILYANRVYELGLDEDLLRKKLKENEERIARCADL